MSEYYNPDPDRISRNTAKAALLYQEKMKDARDNPFVGSMGSVVNNLARGCIARSYDVPPSAVPIAEDFRNLLRSVWRALVLKTHISTFSTKRELFRQILEMDMDDSVRRIIALAKGGTPDSDLFQRELKDMDTYLQLFNDVQQANIKKAQQTFLVLKLAVKPPA